MEDVDVGEEGEENGDMDEKDDAELCYEKHTGNKLKNNKRGLNVVCKETVVLVVGRGNKCLVFTY